jgi:hypothetical protein
VQYRGAAASPDVVERSDRRRWSGWYGAMQLSRWPQAAAAVLLFAAGMAVSQLHVETSDGAFVVRTRPASAPAEVQVFSGRTTSISLPAGRLEVAASDAQASAPAIDVEQVLQRVRAMIDQSEQRQQRELALRLSQVANEVDAQHQADLLRIQQNLGQQQDDFMNYLVRTGGPK